MSVLVYGATGRTGALVAAHLDARGALRAIAGQSSARLDALARSFRPRPAQLALPLSSPGSLTEALRGFTWVVNCAGPFARTAQVLARSAAAAGAHYMDLSGEGPAIEALRLVEPEALRSGLCLCPGVGAVGALGDWLADRCAAALGETPEAVDVVYVQSAEQILNLSSGSLKSALRHTMGEAFPAGEQIVRVDLPEPFGAGWGVRVDGPEATLLPRRLPGCRARTFYAPHPGHPLHAWLAAALQRGGPMLCRLEPILDGRWGRLHRRLYGGIARRWAGPVGGAVLVRGFGRGRVVEYLSTFADAYATSAELVARLLDRLIRAPAPPPGLRSPGQLTEATAMLEELEGAGVIETRGRIRGDRSR